MIQSKICKMLSATIAATMLASVMTACGGGNAPAVQSGSGGEAAQDSGAVETVNVTYFSFNNFDDVAKVEEAVNEITEKEIGVHVKLNCLEGGQFISQQAMLLSGGEDIDLIVTPVVTDAMNSGAFLDMSELLDEEGL